MRVLPYSIIFTLVLLGFSHWTLAQKPAPAAPAAPAAPPAPTNQFKNHSFEAATPRADLWNGITPDGFLQAWGGSAPALSHNGQMGDNAMPLSVAVADMNNDKKLDIITADVVGYFRIYFNIGTEKDPKFGFGELVPVYLSRTHQNDEQYRYRSQRITVGNFANSGKNEMMIGNYMGEILWLKNEGSVHSPDFRQPGSRQEIKVPTTQDTAERWGNLFAPAAWDWNKDGKFDLLVGEGSYSANAVHLLLNQGSGPFPKFNEKNRHFLAFGDGREQLNPTVVDYNGDGKMDLLVGDRSGQIGLYLNRLALWKPDDEIKFTSYVPITGGDGKPVNFGGICTVATGDLNGDGLFDLVVGSVHGRVHFVYNTGTPQEPKFASPMDPRSATPPKVLQSPDGWNFDFGLAKGNFYANVDVVTAETQPELAPPHGAKVLKFSYLANPNTIIKTPFVYSPALVGYGGENAGHNGPANYFNLSQGNLQFKPGKTYLLTFKIKGNNVNDTEARISYGARKKMAETQIIRGERNSATVREFFIDEHKTEKLDFTPSATWTTVTKQFKIQFSNPELNKPDTGVGGGFHMSFALTPGKGEFFLDDIQLTERP